MKNNRTLIHLVFLLVVLLATNSVLNAQQRITGKVTDTDGESLPGVTIYIKDTTQGTVTDIDGNYSLNASSGQIIVFSFIGMQTQEVLLTGQTIINIQLEPAAHNLAEVQVVAYGEQARITVTGAISSVSSEQLLKSPAASVASSLAGQVTGFSSVQFSGQPGADDPSIYVRGLASLSEDRSQPMMIVDGVERSFMQLDPNEIESISILKDASATAVYGVRGANGVIIVTTKRGRPGEARINASVSTGMQVPTRLLEFADSYTYALMHNEARLNDNPNLDPATLSFSPEIIEAFRTNSDPIIFPNTDWLDYLMKPYAMQNQANVNISGGSDRVNYFVSVGYLNQDGLFRTFDVDHDYNFAYNRYNYRANLDINVTETTKLGITSGGRVGVRNEPNPQDGMNEFFRWIYNSVPWASPGIVDGKMVTGGNQYIPLQGISALTRIHGQGFTNQLTNNLNFDIDLSQKLDAVTKGLNFRTKLSYNSFYSHTKVRNSSRYRYIPFYRRDVDPTADPNDMTIVYRQEGSQGALSYGENFGKGRNWYFETGFSYNNRFGLHNVGGLVLYNHNRVYYPAQWSEIPAGLVGLVGRATYDYDTKYMFDFNIGYNGSENFIREHRYGVFPAFSVGWIPTRESFMPDISFIEYIKLRASYGLVGNDKIGGSRFLYLPDSFNPRTGGYSFGTDNPTNRPAAAEGQIGNPMVTWEKALKQNFGVDMIMFRNLSASFDYFIENRRDILTLRGTVPGFVAYSLPAVNIGEVKNQGYEIELKWNRRIQPDVRYWINMNMSYAKNEIIFMDEVPQDEPYLYRTGHSVGQPFGYVFDRFYNPNDPGIDNLPDHQYTLYPGDLVYKDLNGDGVINHLDMMAIGFPNYPQYTFGANMGFQIKNFDFSMSWVGSTNTSRLLDESFKVAFGTLGNRSLLQYMADGRWTPETAETATYPRMTFDGIPGNIRESTFWLKDASYLRLKNVELGYNFSGNMLGSLGLRNLRVYVNGHNLITLDRLEIADPETRTTSRPTYPLLKIYNLGVRANF
jgi:TonB-linked SusC/RagA family outer membrane protein